MPAVSNDQRDRAGGAACTVSISGKMLMVGYTVKGIGKDNPTLLFNRAPHGAFDDKALQHYEENH